MENCSVSDLHQIETRADEGGLDKYRGTVRQRGLRASRGHKLGSICWAVGHSARNMLAEQQRCKAGRGMARVTVRFNGRSPMLHQRFLIRNRGRRPMAASPFFSCSTTS